MIRYLNLKARQKVKPSEIVDYLGDWKYVFAGSPDQLVKELIKVKAVYKASGKYTESDTERDTIYKGIKALGSKFKKVKVID